MNAVNLNSGTGQVNGRKGIPMSELASWARLVSIKCLDCRGAVPEQSPVKGREEPMSVATIFIGQGSSYPLPHGLRLAELQACAASSPPPHAARVATFTRGDGVG